MKFTLTIDCDNAAFDPPEVEISRILREVADAMLDGDTGGSEQDINSNNVCQFDLTET